MFAAQMITVCKMNSCITWKSSLPRSSVQIFRSCQCRASDEQVFSSHSTANGRSRTKGPGCGCKGSTARTSSKFLAYMAGGLLVGVEDLVVPDVSSAADTVMDLAASGPVDSAVTFLALGFGSFALAYTLLLTGRFLMTVFPTVERKRAEFPYSILVASTKPAVDQIRGLINYEDGNIDGSPVVLLGLLSVFHDSFFGSTGILLPFISSAALQEFLQITLLLERGILIPASLLLSLRWTGVI